MLILFRALLFVINNKCYDKNRTRVDNCFFACNCTSYSPELTEALVLSGENRKELLHVLEHYEHDEDTLKYKAACFLIENMRWHKSYRKVQHVDLKIPKLYEKLDYLYTKALKGYNKVSTLDSNRLLSNQLWNYAQART